MAKPDPSLPKPEWAHFGLYSKVKEAIYALPGHFSSKTNIEGMMATDIFTLNAALAATIEEQVVAALNSMRPIWDPASKYQTCYFARQSQTFPDVILRKRGNGNSIILGIELKGWYLLAKEGEPNFRFTATEAACNPQDLLVVVPWTLSNVISGTPNVFPPFIESAKYAAAYRNYHWTELREASSNKKISIPKGVNPYPKKSDEIADKPASDSGGNFGRFARTGLMNDYLESALSTKICGVTAKDWRKFFLEQGKPEKGGNT